MDKLEDTHAIIIGALAARDARSLETAVDPEIIAREMYLFPHELGPALEKLIATGLVEEHGVTAGRNLPKTAV